ncbi:unnamed protein product [Brachionus calyciflorus]|uniref:Uncharacterized protein n=1 Tax=Brachionus calyciflorus TaxID=104777 RepID=A0A814AGW2_9BILA|nr:unnamed protein product [Brachionus calyciflorus]
MKEPKKLFYLSLIVACLLIFGYFFNGESYFTVIFKQPLFIKHNRYHVNCKAIINNDEEEIKKAENILKSLILKDGYIRQSLDSDFIIEKSQCDYYKKTRGYYRHKSVDADYPLGVTILAHESAEQLERLLRTLYQPQNIYCIHVDKKSDENLHKSIKSIADCFDNVFIASETYDIVYLGFSRLKAEFQCLKDLLMLDKLKNIEKHPNLIGKKVVDWKYAFNYVGTEFPLITNRDLVKILKMYNGSNEIQVIPERFQHRYYNRFKEDFRNYKIHITNQLNPPPPNGYKISKGFASYVISRKFAEYAVFDPRSLSLFNWLKYTLGPEELFWSTLQFNTHIYSDHGFEDLSLSESSLLRYSGWYPYYECKGIIRHEMCVFGIRDLPNILKNRTEYLINKFMLNVDPIAYQCMEEWFDEKEKAKSNLNFDFYCNFIKARSKLANC